MVRFCPGEWRIVDERELLAAALHHMTVDRVPARVADAADEPASVDAGIRVEHLPGRLDPVDVLRGLAPEALRVALPTRIDLVIAAGAGIHGAAPMFRRWLRSPARGHSEAARGLCKPRGPTIRPCRKGWRRAGANRPQDWADIAPRPSASLSAGHFWGKVEQTPWRAEPRADTRPLRTAEAGRR